MVQVVVTPTFAEKLQEAISAFTAGLTALKTTGVAVEDAADAVSAAQTQLTQTEADQQIVISSATTAGTDATAARDALIAVLQSWTA